MGPEGAGAAGNWHGLGPLLAATPPCEGETPPYPASAVAGIIEAFEWAKEASGVAAARAGASGDWFDLTAARSCGRTIEAAAAWDSSEGGRPGDWSAAWKTVGGAVCRRNSSTGGLAVKDATAASTAPGFRALLACAAAQAATLGGRASSSKAPGAGQRRQRRRRRLPGFRPISSRSPRAVSPWLECAPPCASP